MRKAIRPISNSPFAPEPPEVHLKRIQQNKYQTQGELWYQGKRLAYILENPWLNNQVEISCIPAGHYIMRQFESPNFGLCFDIPNVPGRSLIRMHAGNTFKDTLGCLLPGKAWKDIDGDQIKDVTDSRRTLAKLLKIIPKEVRLIITDPIR